MFYVNSVSVSSSLQSIDSVFSQQANNCHADVYRAISTTSHTTHN